MHRRIYQEFEQICTERGVRGSVLEVGAVPLDESLLCMKALSGAAEKVGIDLDGPHEYKDFKIVKGNGNSMDCFPNDRFDTVVCNATLEHDKYFWKTLAEIKRVARPGALIVIGVPGFDKLRAEKIKAILRRTPIVSLLDKHEHFNMLFTATVTYGVHNWPGDYYRFSPQAVREVFLEGLEQTEVRSIMSPPRLIGIGYKPKAS
jgi:SAM-dependent methyltransferase